MASKPTHGGSGGGGSTSTTDPQVAYVHISRSGTREIRLANEDGTGSALLATSTASNVTVRLAPRAQHQLAYTSGSNIHLLTYDVTSTGVKTVSDVPIAAAATGTFAFSPTGTQLAWLNGAGNGVYLHDLGTGDTRLLVDTGSDYVVDIDFTADGSHLVYTQSLDPEISAVQFKSVPVGGGDPVDLPIQGRYGYFRLGHTSDSIVTDSLASSGPMSFFAAGSSSPTVFANGSHPALRCDDKVVIYNTFTSHSETALKYDLTTGLGSTFGSLAYFPDYFPDCP